MIAINRYIIEKLIEEKLILNKNTKVVSYTLDELLNDYEDCGQATRAYQLLKIANKYHCNSNKKRDIQIKILDEARNLRHHTIEYSYRDILLFLRYDIPDAYTKYKKYLDQESKKFIEYLYEYYTKISNSISQTGGPKNFNDYHQLKILDNLKKYLKIKR